MPADPNQGAPAGDQQQEQGAPAGDQQQEQGQEQQQQAPAKMTVDVHGVSVEVDEETARKIIEKRQATKEELRKLEEQLEQQSRQREQAEARARAAEAARNGDLAKVEEELSSKYVDRVNKMQRAVVRSSVTAAVQAHPDFIGGAEATEDAVNMLLGASELTVDEGTLTVKAKDKTVQEVVDAFLATRDYFRKAKPGPRGVRGQQTPANPQQGKQPLNPRQVREAIAKGLQRSLGGAK